MGTRFCVQFYEASFGFGFSFTKSVAAFGRFCHLKSYVEFYGTHVLQDLL